MGKFYVYEHWRPDKGSCFYVGKGTGKRAWFLPGRKGYHANIVKKLASLDLTTDVRIVADGLDEATAHALEIERIALWRSQGIRLTNITNGGEGVSGLVHSVETRAKMSESRSGRPLSEMHRARVSAGLTGKKHKLSPEGEAKRLAGLRSVEVRAKIGKAGKGRIHSVEARAKRSASLAKAWAEGRHALPSEETKAKIAATLTGRKLSDETRARLVVAQRKRQDEGRGTKLDAAARAKISATMTGRRMPDEVRAKIATRMSEVAKARPPMSADTKAKIRATKRAKREAKICGSSPPSSSP